MQTALSEDIFAQPLPDFFPDALRNACAGKRIRYKIPRAVRERMQVPDDLTVSEWAARHRHVTAIDAAPGRWRQDLVPHTKKLMDFISLPWVKEVWLCMVERAGKTQILLNAAMWQLDRGIDSGNVFWLMPTESEAKKALGERIIPALKASPRTARLLSRYADDTTRTLVRFKHGPRLLPSWSNSPASIASFFGKINIGDEIDKNADVAGGETDSLTLLKKRGRDSDDSKFLFASTPAGKFIYKGTMACQQVWAFKSRCPHCGDYILMDQDHFVIPEGADVESIKHGTTPLSYACNACGSEWDESDRKAAYQTGDWFAIKGADVDRPESIGGHMPAWALPNIPMTEICAAIARAKTGDLAGKRDLAHGYAAIDYEDKVAERETDAILQLRDERREAELPSAPIAAISAVADMQKRGFWYSIRAWGYGIEQESWLLKTGFVDSWEALRKLFYESEFTDPRGLKHHITLRGIDSGGGESDESELSRTAEAYIFAYKNPGILLFKGQQRMSALHRFSPQDKIPGTNRTLPGGLPYYLLNATQWKNRLAAKLQVAPADPGAWHLHSEYTEDHARQMCAEVRDERGYWDNPKKKPNHLWDCSYMELALVDIHQVKLWPAPNENTTDEKKETNTNAKPKTSRRRW